MAGETSKTTNLTNAQAGVKRAARVKRGDLHVAIDKHQFAAATELEAADNLLLDIEIPSNAVVMEIAMYNDDLDTHACSPTLVQDVGLYALEAFKSVTSGSETKHAVDDVLDADAYVDGSTVGRAATTSWTALAFDATTFGPDDADKMVWEVLGYDSDPGTKFGVVVQSQAASAALSAAGDMAIRVTYSVD